MRNLASTGRLNLILKQNAAMANAAAEWKRMHDPDAMRVFPYVRYHARGDKRTRGEHAALDGKIFAKDDPFLSTHTPPWEFNCRCYLEEITVQEAGKTPELIQPPTPPEKVKVESESGFSFDPAHAFEKYDYSLVKDPGLREEAREGVARILAGQSDQSDGSDGSDGVGAPAGSGGSSGAGGPPKKDFFALLPGLSQKDAEELSRRQKEIEDLAETLDAESKTPEMQADLKAEKTREQCKAEARAAVLEKVMQATDDYVESLPDGALGPLDHYTNKDEGLVNAALRGDVPMTPERKAEILAFSDLLEKGPKYSGICYRGCSFANEGEAKAFVWRMISNPETLTGFTSLSPDFATALYYAQKGPCKVIVVIPNSTHGVYWGPHSSQPRDHETTLDYKVYLKGLAFCQRGDTLYVVAEVVLDAARGL